MKPNLYLKRAALTVLLFFLGAWVFNHFPIPLVGAAVAVGYPVFLLYRLIQKVSESQ